jgi:hypothetical protein
MKVLVRTFSDGSIAIETPNQRVIAELMSGGKLRPENMEQDVQNQMKGGIPEAAARAWSNALVSGGLTEDEVMELYKNRRPSTENCTCEIIDNLVVEDGANDFKEARELVGGAIKANMTKARAIHLTEIRRVRNAELVKEDVTFMRAVEAGDTSAQATIATKKQTLRDIPATFDITTDVDTPEKLKAKWPPELPARE